MQVVPIAGETKQRVHDTLGGSTWFRHLEARARESAEAAQQLERVVGLADLVRYDAGETIVEEGFPSDAFFVLVSGRVTVRRAADAAELGQIAPPHCFGEVGLLLDEPRTASVLAAAETLVLRFRAAAFRTLIDNVPGFGHDTCRHLATRLKELSERLLT